MGKRSLLLDFLLPWEGHQLSQSGAQFPPPHPPSPSLVNLVVIGSLRKFIWKPQIPQVSQIPIWVPLPAALAGGPISKLREK